MLTENTRENLSERVCKRRNREKWTDQTVSITIIAAVSLVGCIILLLILRQYYLAQAEIFLNK